MKNLVCPICSKNLNEEKRHLMGHLIGHNLVRKEETTYRHGDQDLIRHQYICNLCGKETNSAKSYLIHWQHKGHESEISDKKEGEIRMESNLNTGNSSNPTKEETGDKVITRSEELIKASTPNQIIEAVTWLIANNSRCKAQNKALEIEYKTKLSNLETEHIKYIEKTDLTIKNQMVTISDLEKALELEKIARQRADLALKQKITEQQAPLRERIEKEIEQQAIDERSY